MMHIKKHLDGLRTSCVYRHHAEYDSEARYCWQIAQDEEDLMFRYNVCPDCLVFISRGEESA